ncbi:hypothetical protein [Spiroplasma platyhelix]|uniref:Uncharacterized protein n=1 Tax=Spiroplasma platyhelix PALS-1 TaxID=1276218 RepID=A0A846TQ48_9MOLU|nr:hypothetical protein [Spiroplasma platyhelix]MBE4704060.1 hypothetical protein [Spiroplasma platyhelix PALS-1]NKE38430.1 hypothetical protein [Spiroplasma platyhelix PALS-1]UJB29318.1 hypothetical protein SPLAT_v1c05540 [Spiroplasma platyhelix PALS-1]
MKKIEELIDFKLNEKQDYDKYSQIRGQQLYLFIGKYLYKEDIKLNYCYVKDLIRYDKRLKDNLYVYLGTFEDYLKTLIYEKTNYSVNKKFQLSEEIDHSSFIEINTKESYDLAKLIIILEEIEGAKKEEIKDFRKIKDFRNKVMHHNFLLLKYEEKKKIQSRIVWLKDNILMLKKYLPKDYQNNFIKDINNCKKKLLLEKSYKLEEL